MATATAEGSAATYTTSVSQCLQRCTRTPLPASYPLCICGWVSYAVDCAHRFAAVSFRMVASVLSHSYGRPA